MYAVRARCSTRVPTGPSGAVNRTTSTIAVSPVLSAVNVCSCHHLANGPRSCSSTKRRGGSYAVICEVIRNGMPRCQARQVTVSPSAIVPDVTPAIARSLDPLIEAV